MVLTPAAEIDIPGSLEQRVRLGYEDPSWFCRYYLKDLFPLKQPWLHLGLLAILTERTKFLFKQEYFPCVSLIVRNFVVQEDPLDDLGKGKIKKYIFEIYSRKTKEKLSIAEIQFYETFCPEAFTAEHFAIKICRSDYTLIMLPRGFSKTTLAGVGVPIWEMLYERLKVLAYVSESGTHSSMQLNNVRNEFEGNERIRADFGNLVPERKDGKKWTETIAETTTGCTFIARGSGGQIRGLNHKGTRPQKFIVDDLEDKEGVESPERRRKLLEWYYSDLMNALPRVGGHGTVTALGTLLHPKCLLMALAADERWCVIKFGALDIDGNPLWAENMDHSDLQKLRKAMSKNGILHLYYLEYFNKYVSPEHQPFKKEFFIHQASPLDTPVGTAIYMDPAYSFRIGADSTVIAVVSQFKTKYWIREMWGGPGISDRDKINKFFELWGVFDGENPESIYAGVETVAAQASLHQLMVEEMFRRKTYFELEAINSRTNKNERIKGLVPRYSYGHIIHERRFPKYEEQAVLWNPMVKNQPDDWLDGLAGCVKLLDPQIPSMGAEDDDDKEATNVDSLIKVIGMDWRSQRC